MGCHDLAADSPSNKGISTGIACCFPPGGYHQSQKAQEKQPGLLFFDTTGFLPSFYLCTEIPARLFLLSLAHFPGFIRYVLYQGAMEWFHALFYLRAWPLWHMDHDLHHGSFVYREKQV